MRSYLWRRLLVDDNRGSDEVDSERPVSAACARISASGGVSMASFSPVVDMIGIRVARVALRLVTAS